MDISELMRFWSFLKEVRIIFDDHIVILKPKSELYFPADHDLVSHTDLIFSFYFDN